MRGRALDANGSDRRTQLARPLRCAAPMRCQPPLWQPSASP